MKKYFTLSNLATLILIGLFLYLQGPALLNNLKVSENHLSNIQLLNIETHEVISIEKNEKYILFFWATWCAPCKVDMDRYKASIEAGKIPKDKFWAINPFESPEKIKQFIIKEKYPFTYVDDQLVAVRALNITATPTVTFLENEKVTRQSTGISLIGIYRAEWFFD